VRAGRSVDISNSFRGKRNSTRVKVLIDFGRQVLNNTPVLIARLDYSREILHIHKSTHHDPINVSELNFLFGHAALKLISCSPGVPFLGCHGRVLDESG